MPRRSVSDLRRWMFRLSVTRWMVSAWGYRRANSRTTCANSTAERSGVGNVTSLPAPSGGSIRQDLGVERDRLLIQTRNRCMGIEGLLVRPQNIFQLCDIFFIEFGRGRDAGHPAPPAQIPTSGIMEMARIRPNPTQ